MSNPYKISRTSKYDAFKTIKGNRTVRPAHVKKLKLAIQSDPESIKYNPILVNEHLEVIDGQHRLEAIKQLELDVYYVKVDGLKLDDVQILNSVSRNWQPMDYAKAFSTLGNKNYGYYLDVKQGSFSLNHDSLMRYLSLDNPITSQSFNEGKLKVDNYPRSLELLGWLFDIGQYYERYKIRSFALAFLKLATSKGYDQDRMYEQMKNHSRRFLEDYSKEQDYFIALNKIYNYHKRTQVHFGTPEYLMA